jgi:hypothetical protein
MEELIDWFFNMNLSGMELNIQLDETLFCISEIGNIHIRNDFVFAGKTGLAVRVSFRRFPIQKLAATYLAQALNPESGPVKNWPGCIQSNTGGWLMVGSMGTQPIKDLVVALSAEGMKPPTVEAALGRLVASVYPPEYWPLIWQADTELHLVVRTFLNNYDTFNLIVLLLKQVLQADNLAAGRANKIYQPRPHYITDVREDNLMLGNGSARTISSLVTGLDQLVQWLNSARINISGTAATINYAAMPTESDLYSLDWLAYEMLLCAIQNFTQFKLDNYSLPISTDTKKLSENIRVFRVQYNDLSLAKRFDPLMTQTGKTLFHGSALPNWYSIFYNGLYDGTKSKLLLNGAAHGIGIYLSNNFNMSLGYSIRGTITDPYLIGVFQIETTDVKTYQKTDNIFVVNNAEILALRYLIWVDTPTSCPAAKSRLSQQRVTEDDQKLLNNYFISDGAARQTLAETQLKSSKGIVRKQKECQKMVEQQNTPDCGLDYKFDLPDEDNFNRWHISVSRANFYDSDPTISPTAQNLLYQDMLACGVEYINFEITLPDDYPLSPPFIRIITPRFVHLTGHITIGGSICSELLMKQNWVPTLSILKVMIIVCHNMVDGGARLERGSGLIRPYTFAEAESAYNRMIRTHGAEWSNSKK